MDGSLLGESLLQWVNSFNTGADVKSGRDWQALTDGRALWSILQHDVDASYFAGSLPEPDVGPSGDWTRKWQNLRYLERQVALYYRDICNGHQENEGAVPDTKAIAADASVADMERLIMGIIRAAMASPEANQTMAARLMGLGREKAMIIANELRAMEDVGEGMDSEPPSHDESADQSDGEGPVEPARMNGGKISDGRGLYRDPLLEREEELLRAHATIDKLQASHDVAQRQLQKLRLDKDKLQEAFDEYRVEIDSSKGRKGGVGGEASLKKLERQAESDRAYIEDLENQLQASRVAVEGYEKSLERYRAESEAVQKLRDDLQMLRVENDDLQQKIRANENLKKKIQTLQEQDKANLSLREQLKLANEKLDDLEHLNQQQRKLEREIIEKQGLIRNQEYQINEISALRRNVEANNRKLVQDLDAARDRHERDFDRIKDLEGRLDGTDLVDAAEEDAEQKPAAPDTDQKSVNTKTDEDARHWADKVSMLEKQLEASDARLRQANERLATQDGVEDTAERARAGHELAQRQVDEHEGTIADLRRQLESGGKQQKDAGPAHDMATLQRENQLLKTAWYDLAGRLQNNGVSLGRRRQEPKSWIGKQRALVGPGGGIQR